MTYKTLICTSLLSTAALLSGCTSYNDQQDSRIDATTQYVQGELAQARERNAQLEQDQAILNRQVQQLSSTVDEQNQRMGKLQSEISELQAAIRQLNEAREADRKAIVDQISKTVARLVNESRPRTPPATSGKIHVVEQGHTLSGIASAFGVTVDAIKRANNLRSDVIRVGQELIIPD